MLRTWCTDVWLLRSALVNLSNDSSHWVTMWTSAKPKVTTFLLPSVVYFIETSDGTGIEVLSFFSVDVNTYALVFFVPQIEIGGTWNHSWSMWPYNETISVIHFTCHCVLRVMDGRCCFSTYFRCFSLQKSCHHFSAYALSTSDLNGLTMLMIL